MRPLTVLLLLLGVTLAGAAGTAVFLTRDLWRGWLPGRTPASADKGHDKEHPHADRVEITPQAMKTLGLEVKPLELEVYWRELSVPGVVVERRGEGDRTVTAPIAGIVLQSLALPGEAVSPGRPLFVLRPTSESLQNSQTELLKAVQELKVLRERYERLAGASAGAVPESRLLELKGQIDRLEGVRKAQRIDLGVRGLAPEQLDDVEKGKFLDRLTVHAPSAPSGVAARAFDVEEIKVNVGEQVQAGQVLSRLADHLDLYVEGQGFMGDAALLEKAAMNCWDVTVEVAGEPGRPWKRLQQKLVIQHLAGSLELGSQALEFYLPLPNQSRDYQRDGRTYRVWDHRPGQRVRLQVRVDNLEGVFVLPADAVVRRGPEAYVFQQNGDAFERKPVHVLFEGPARVAIANDGSVTRGSRVAHNGAAALQRALEAQQEGGGHGHDHHGHSH